MFNIPRNESVTSLVRIPHGSIPHFRPIILERHYHVTTCGDMEFRLKTVCSLGEFQ